MHIEEKVVSLKIAQVLERSAGWVRFTEHAWWRNTEGWHVSHTPEARTLTDTRRERHLIAGIHVAPDVSELLAVLKPLGIISIHMDATGVAAALTSPVMPDGYLVRSDTLPNTLAQLVIEAMAAQKSNVDGWSSMAGAATKGHPTGATPGPRPAVRIETLTASKRTSP